MVQTARMDARSGMARAAVAGHWRMHLDHVTFGKRHADGMFDHRQRWRFADDGQPGLAGAPRNFIDIRAVQSLQPDAAQRGALGPMQDQFGMARI